MSDFVWSWEIHLRKPDADAFSQALARAGLAEDYETDQQAEAIQRLHGEVYAAIARWWQTDPLAQVALRSEPELW